MVTARRLAPVAFGLLLWALASMVAYRAWIVGADHRDFYPRWAGARLALFDRLDPYADSTTARLQSMLYGERLPEGADQQGFAYPAHLIPLLLPLWWVEEVEIAAAVWEGFSFVAIVYVLWLLGRAASRPRPWVPVWLAAWAYPALVVFQGQMTVLPILGLAVGLWAYMEGKDWLAGAALVLITIKPELTLLPLAGFSYLAVRERRWKILAGFALIGAIAFVAAFLIAGWWVPGWLTQLGRYAEYAKVSWAPQTAWQLHPLIALSALAVLVVALLRAGWSDEYLLAGTVPLGLLLLPQTLLWSLAVLLVPLMLIWRGRMRWGVAGVWGLGWVLLIAASSGIGWRVQMLLFPLLTLLLLWRRKD